MRALVLRENSFQIEDFDLPELNSGEVKVKISAAALNHRDVWIRDGQYAKIQFPAIVGSDGCGTVVGVRDSFNDHLLGKNVILNPSLNWGDDPKAQSAAYHVLGMPSYGTFAEYVNIPADRVVNKPEYLSDEQAAALPLAGVTAYRALARQGNVEHEQNVLVTGIGGGVALFALQFAKALGANVYVTSGSDEKLRRARELGAAGGVNYKNEGWDKELQTLVKSFDLVIDGTGGAQMNSFLGIVRPGGTIVCYGATLGATDKLMLAKLFWKQITLRGSTMGNDEDFSGLVRLVERNRIEPVIDSVVPFDRILEAFDTMKNARQFGKLVVKF